MLCIGLLNVTNTELYLVISRVCFSRSGIPRTWHCSKCRIFQGALTRCRSSCRCLPIGWSRGGGGSIEPDLYQLRSAAVPTKNSPLYTLVYMLSRQSVIVAWQLQFIHIRFEQFKKCISFVKFSSHIQKSPLPVQKQTQLWYVCPQPRTLISHCHCAVTVVPRYV